MLKGPGKKVAVLGLGISGYQSALELNRRGYQVFASDGGESDSLRDRARSLNQAGIQCEIGGHTSEKVLSCDWAVISPGIPPSSKIFQALRAAAKPVYSEIEAASWFCPSENVIAVTGSAGKTTVTTLIADLLERAGKKVFRCGNIGNPWIGELPAISKDDFVVIELSSFQLAQCESFRPHIGILLNLSPNHQDWHADMNDYAQAKLRLFKNQKPGDYAIIRRKDQVEQFPHFEFKAQVILFDQKPSANPNEDVLKEVACLLKLDGRLADATLKEFTGIEHRLERFASSGGVTYMNDSKATTTASLAWALQKFADKSVVLIAGGHPKSNDFAVIRDLISQKVKFIVMIGEARPLLREAWKGLADFFETNDFKTAVEKAKSAAVKGDTVLLSPACASFDMFKNYEERGRLFKKHVMEITAASVGV